MPCFEFRESILCLFLIEYSILIPRGFASACMCACVCECTHMCFFGGGEGKGGLNWGREKASSLHQG